MKTAKTGVHPLLEPIQRPECDLEGFGFAGENRGPVLGEITGICDYPHPIDERGEIEGATGFMAAIPADLHAIGLDDGRMGGTQRGDAIGIARGCRKFFEARGQKLRGFRGGFNFGARAAA